MRILQLPSWYLPEGGQFCLDQSLALQEQGLEVHILANVVLPWRRYKLSVFRYPLKSFFAIENGIPIYRYYSWKYPFVDKLNIEKWTKKTVDLFDEYKEKYGLPDIIHVHSSMWGGYAASRIKEKYGVPYVITEHRGIFGVKTKYAKQKFKKSYKPYLIKAFSNADYIIPVSYQLIGKISEYLTKNVPIKAISNILDTSYFYPLGTKVSDKNDRFTFVSVNGFNSVKGYEYLIPAFDKVCKKKQNVYLRIVGENFEKKQFQKILKKSNSLHRISFSGELDKEGVREELWKADAFVIASIVESQSVATLEAMSTGLPVVGTEVIPADILTEKCGYRVPVENISKLADGMVKMVETKSNFDGNEISNYVQPIVSKKEVTHQLIEVYEQVLKK
ncbi:MAG: glycosyltransferase [Paludibacteraceae bacterium]|nr:glycosyltransferase [Paludibacteraceae bacterium]